MGVKKYIHDLVEPFVARLKDVISKLIGIVGLYERHLQEANRNVHYYKDHSSYLEKQNEKLKEDSEILDTVWRELGDDKINEILVRAEERQRADEYEEDEPERNGWDDLSL